MLKELSRIAREMMFLQGHVTRPQEWADDVPEAAPREVPKIKPPRPNAKARGGFLPANAAGANGCG